MAQVSLAKAESDAKSDHSGTVKGMGFEQREVGPHTVNVFYYSVEHKPTFDIEFMEHRASFYVDGKQVAGVSF